MDRLVFPAHAGVIPVKHEIMPDMTGLSRTRGGDPILGQAYIIPYGSFPHTRG